MQTWAPCSMAASATQNPIPDVPPKMSTWASWSFEVYFVGDMVLYKGRFCFAVLRGSWCNIGEVWNWDEWFMRNVGITLLQILIAQSIMLAISRTDDLMFISFLTPTPYLNP